MGIGRRNYQAVLLPAALGIGCVVLVMHGSARASSISGLSPAGHREPSGPELSPREAAEAAIKDAWVGRMAAGDVSIRVAHGRFAQVSTVLNGKEAVSGSTTSGESSCFPGLSCATADVEEHERVQRELDESSAYVLEMRGIAFSPSIERVRKGEKVTTSPGELESVIVDAHTGMPEARTIGGKRLNLESLGTVTELIATISIGASAQASPTVRLRANHSSGRRGARVLVRRRLRLSPDVHEDRRQDGKGALHRGGDRHRRAG
jgi:hypothetical protein